MIIADFVWEKTKGARYSSINCILAADDFNAAVKIGAGGRALYFRVLEAEDAGRRFIPGRYFTNVGEIRDTAALIKYLEEQKYVGKKTLRRMFSRVAAGPGEQSKFSAIHSVDEAIELLRKAPADTYFLTPGKGGFIKLEADDKAYDRAGRQIWPQKTPPAKSFFLRI